MPLLFILPIGAAAGWLAKSKMDAMFSTGMSSLYRPDPLALAPWALLLIGGVLVAKLK